MQACVDWVLIVFGAQVIKKKRPVRSVFPDYLSISYDYNFFDVVKNRTLNKFTKINLKEIETSCRSTHQRCSIKKRRFLETAQNSQENTCARVSFLVKFLISFFKKETLAQVFSCEFCEIFCRTPLDDLLLFKKRKCHANVLQLLTIEKHFPKTIN